jgi:hypothetical protein
MSISLESGCKLSAQAVSDLRSQCEVSWQ